MKTPMQELIDTFEEMNTGYNPTIDVPLAISLMRSRLEKEKEVMCKFAEKLISTKGPTYINKYGGISLEETTPEFFDKTFNTNEQ